MPSTKKVRIIPSEHDEVMSALRENTIALEQIRSELEATKTELATRRHLDEDIAQIKKDLAGNGKPGWFQVRDLVLGFQARNNAIYLLLIGVLISQFAILLFGR